TEITLPRQISREGYTFDGWYDNSNFTNTEISRIENDEVGNKLFYAKWLVNTYDITLNTNEGTINSGNVSNYTYGYGISLPSDVTKPGYSFAGWYADEDFTTARITRVSETMSGNLVFYAKWTENTYSITLNVNDGTIAEEYVSNYTYGMGSTLPTNVTRQGYTFMGWFVNSNFDGSAVKAVSATEYGDKTFWAKWQVETYTVTLQTNGGTINAGNISGYMFGVGAELPSDVTKTGHSFVGWYADEDFNSAEFSAIAVNETGDKTFYAKWTVDNYSILYNINGGMINKDELDEYTYGFGAELPTDVTRTGYTFVGWYDNVNLIGTPFTEITEEDFGNKSFYAKWNTNIYAIEYDVNGGTINSGNVTSYQYGSDVILPTDVTRQGYTFTGWHFVAQDMTEEEGAVAIMQVSSIDFGDKTYYAWWTNNTYTITYFTDQGTINEEPTITYTYGEVTTLPTDVTREGYTFAGWFSNSSYSGSSVLTVPATETGNKEFWARWEVNSYAVTLDVDGGDINSGNVASYTYNVLTILPQDVTKVGHTFEGWFDSENQKVTQISKGTIGDVTFTAHWTAKTYSVTLQTNNGTISTGNVTSYTFGTAVALPTKEQISKTGYAFDGWYDYSSCRGTAQTGISADATGNKSFWAKWTVNSYTVTLNANGGTINNGNVTNYTYGVSATLPADVTKTGYTFNGWYDNDEFAGEAITTVANNETGDKTFFAKFTVNTYNVILVTNEGTINAGNVESYEFGKGATLPTDVTKEGYSFGGWYSNSSYIGGSVSSIASNDMGDKQFWAKWTINEYEVTATAENGTVEGTGSYEYKSTATLKAVPNDGYEFVGWNDNTLTDARIQFVVTKDTTLTANFKEKEKVQISGTLEIPTLKTERESAPIDLAGLFTTTEGGEVTYSATSSAPNVVAATVSEGKLFLTVYEYEGEAEITVTAILPNGEKNSVKATANVVLACNIQVEETITNVSCFGESDGEIALKVTNAAEPYTTQWTSDNGFASTEDTIRNIKKGDYVVSITDAEGCGFTRKYSVNQPAEMKMKATVKNPTCENADGSISIVLTGAENATFAWSNEATTQNIASLEKGDYSVVITNTETGCQISDSYTLVEPTAPVVAISNVISTACNEKSGAVIISGDDNLIYHWNNGRSTKNLLNVNAGDYTLVVTDENNCTATLDVTVPSIPLKQPEIALVTVSEQTGKNLVVWLKENTDLIDFYTIYRESERKDVFEALATVPYSELSVYEDEEADPNIQPWRYKISATDVCGEETAMSEYHTTMHIAKVAGADTEENKNQTNLIWNAYEGIDYESFIVMCKHKENGKIL
ncbi:MAG: InlB B-repeat-containing protein, partial [Bacteroidales bacterium]|nr:InlB B-repeat-containing protein [Bacteroidales bacterium]